ncbi:MAG: hypothetical protein HFF17_06740, partial [Oscillospiraceae bacterium]|nr:hypothetical protein [Oscillospiraceae bacterium]
MLFFGVSKDPFNGFLAQGVKALVFRAAISATVGENFIEEPGLHRTLIGDGIATSLSAIFGGP